MFEAKNIKNNQIHDFHLFDDDGLSTSQLTYD